MSGAIQQNVVWLKISVNNPTGMKEAQFANELRSKESDGEIEKIDVKHFAY